jgi:hypothetical protein
MNNGSCTKPEASANSPWALSPYAHLANLKPPGEPYSADTLALAEDAEKVRAIIATGALDKFPMEERIKIGWNIIRHDNEVQN